MDMSQEKKPIRKRLLPEGWRTFKILECSDEVKSKAGNNQYIIRIQDKETQYEEDLYAVSEPKKRWFLKEILDACGVPHVEGIYKFEPTLASAIVGKEIQGLVEHQPNDWIDRNGNEVKGTQHKIVEVKFPESSPEQAWDADKQTQGWEE